MTKQEMAEWLAEKVLGWEQGKRGNQAWFKPARDFGKVKALEPILGGRYPELIDIIYSPDGFFAVWDALEVKAECTVTVTFFGDKKGNVGCMMEFGAKLNDTGINYGKTRREAFYNAVYEAMK